MSVIFSLFGTRQSPWLKRHLPGRSPQAAFSHGEPPLDVKWISSRLYAAPLVALLHESATTRRSSDRHWIKYSPFESARGGEYTQLWLCADVAAWQIWCALRANTLKGRGNTKLRVVRTLQIFDLDPIKRGGNCLLKWRCRDFRVSSFFARAALAAAAAAAGDDDDVCVGVFYFVSSVGLPSSTVQTTPDKRWI